MVSNNRSLGGMAQQTIEKIMKVTKIINRIAVATILLGAMAISSTSEAGWFNSNESKQDKFETCMIEGMRDQHIKMRTIVIKSCKRKNPEGYKQWKRNWNK